MGLGDSLEKFFTKDLLVRVAAARTTELVREMCRVQRTGPAATIALGRAVSGALLMASHLRDGHRVSLEFRGNGPLGRLFAEASFEGEARGYVSHPTAGNEPNSSGRLAVGPAVGQGVLAVTRSQPWEKTPHTGIVPIATGEIGDDIAFYYFQSHQVPSVVALSVSLSPEGAVTAAGGLIVEVMPGAPAALLDTLQQAAAAAGPLSTQLLAESSLAAIVARYVPGATVALAHPHPPRFVCRCTRDRVERSLRLMGLGMLDGLLSQGQGTTLTCQFCGRSYAVSAEDLLRLGEELSDDDASGTTTH
jgi:molecular chaperone Hsp33